MDHYTLTAQQIEQLKATWASLPDGPTFSDLLKPLVSESALETRTCLPGEVVFREGEDDDAMYMIQSGLVAIVKGDLKDPVILAHRGEGDVFGEMALLDRLPRSASVIALDTVKLLCLRQPDFQALLAGNPALAMQILTMLSTRLRMADNLRAAISRLEQKLKRELEVAGLMQARLLPATLPTLPGWTIAAALSPARQTSGDYYDLIPLEGGRLGLVMADVADKGAASALVMAVSRTLIHAFALVHPTDPARVFAITNERLLCDTTTDLFVTALYGVLDPGTGQLTYVNGGHNPAYVFRAGGAVDVLGRTGLPLGAFEDMTWDVKTIQLEAGDLLVLYTDGLTEARNAAREDFGTDRLAAVVQAHAGRSVSDIQAALLAAVQAFAGDAPQHDDITLMILQRGDGTI